MPGVPSEGEKRAGAREVVGVPVLPPAPVGDLAQRVRGWLGRLHRGMAPPPIRILEGLFGLLDAGALVALHELRVADALTGRTAVADLAARLDVDAPSLERLVRYAAARGWLRIDRKGRVAPNGVTRFLRTDHPGGWHAWVELVGGRDVLDTVRGLGESVRTGEDAFAAANGAPFFDWMGDHPERHRGLRRRDVGRWSTARARAGRSDRLVRLDDASATSAAVTARRCASCWTTTATWRACCSTSPT